MSDEEEEQEYTDIDPEIRAEILKPSSTRSKIVVTLKVPKDETTGKIRRVWTDNDKVEYVLDPYDKIRMRLLKEKEELYKAYEKTIHELETRKELQPFRRDVPILLKWPLILFEAIFLIVLAYAFFLIIQLALFNLVILGILVVFMKKLF